jgi:hypothetical protein
MKKAENLSLSKKRRREEENIHQEEENIHHEEENIHHEEENTHQEEESKKRPCEESKQIELTDLPIDVFELIMFEAPQLRFASPSLYNKTKGWKLPIGAQYPSLINENLMCITHTQGSFSGKIMIEYPEQYFHDRSYPIHNGQDPYDIRRMSKVMCFNCLEKKPLPSRPYYKRVKPCPGNYSSVISCCSKECYDKLNTMISLTAVKQLKNRKIKIPSLGENYKDVEFYLASVIPQSDGEKLSYYFQGSLVNYQEISVWASFDQIDNWISTWSSIDNIEFLE